MAIEIVDLPIKNGGSFHSYVSLPEGIICMIRWIEEILHQLKTVVYPCLSHYLLGFNKPFGGAGFRNHPQYVRCYMLLSTHFSGGLSHFVSSFQMIFLGGIPFTRWISIDFCQISIEDSWCKGKKTRGLELSRRTGAVQASMFPSDHPGAMQLALCLTQ